MRSESKSPAARRSDRARKQEIAVSAMTGQLGTIDRLYVLAAGTAIAPDRSVYTPGKWQGEPATLSCHAYLLQRRGEWILWDTGIDERLADAPEGRIIAHGIRGLVTKPLTAQLAEIGLAPADVAMVLLSHAHFDHIGNARLFRDARWYIQRRSTRRCSARTSAPSATRHCSTIASGKPASN
ncbi:MBL fold metallo-hydrolase [Bradyrhizobium sp. HKCCYLS3013]|uniref:MBL fold metallo-hydrolase n=1 Tax=Bradyrhizobium sp. HKCCYLS3013 TaxID=3420735 RepID=UPI003EB8EC28